MHAILKDVLRYHCAQQQYMEYCRTALAHQFQHHRQQQVHVSKESGSSFHIDNLSSSFGTSDTTTDNISTGGSTGSKESDLDSAMATLSSQSLSDASSLSGVSDSTGTSDIDLEGSISAESSMSSGYRSHSTIHESDSGNNGDIESDADSSDEESVWMPSRSVHAKILQKALHEIEKMYEKHYEVCRTILIESSCLICI